MALDVAGLIPELDTAADGSGTAEIAVAADMDMAAAVSVAVVVFVDLDVAEGELDAAVLGGLPSFVDAQLQLCAAPG